jgi:hypothetical protein
VIYADTLAGIRASPVAVEIGAEEKNVLHPSAVGPREEV